MIYVNPLTNGISKGGNVLADSARRDVALRELEQYFVYTLLEEMRKSVPKDSLVPKTQADQFAEQMYDDIMSKQIAETGKFGIARMVDQQMRLNETRDAKVLQEPLHDTPPVTPPATPMVRAYQR
ncbi:MAG: hypothetical protein AMXMBFR84_09470 [Candidatus Hydrogenedentota bacterium]